MKKDILSICAFALLFAMPTAGQSVVRIPGPGGVSPSGGGKTLVQTCTPVNSTSSTTSITVTCTGVVAGHQLIVGGGLGDEAGAACADNHASTYSAPIFGGAESSVTAFECHTFNVLTGGSITITVSWTNPQISMVFAQEWSGISSSGQPDATDLADSVGASQTAMTWPGINGGTITTTGSSDLIITILGNGGVNNTYTAGTGIIPTNGQVSGGGQSAMFQYHTGVAAGSHTETATAATAEFGSLIAIAFK